MVSVAMSTDGTMIASGGQDATVRLWNAASGAAMTTLRGLGSDVRAVAFTPNGRSILAGDSTGRVCRWDISNPTSASAAETILASSTDPLGTLAIQFSTDASRIARRGSAISVHTTMGVLVWSSLAPGMGDKPLLAGLDFSPDGQLLSYPVGEPSSDDPAHTEWSIIVVDAETGNRMGDPISAPGGAPPSIAYVDGRRFVFPTSRGIEWVDLEKGRRGRMPTEWLGRAVFVAGTPNGLVISSGHEGRRHLLAMWALGSDAPLAVARGHEAHVLGAAFDRRTGRIATAGYDGSVRVWGQPLMPDSDLPITFRDDPSMLALSGAGGVVRASHNIRRYSIRENKIAEEMHKDRANCLSDREFFLSWQVLGSDRPRIISYPDAAIGYDMALGPDGSAFALAYAARGGRSLARVMLAPTPDASRRIVFDAHSGIITSVSFSPDGTRLLTTAANLPTAGGQDRTPADAPAAVWDATSGKLIAAARTSERVACRARFCPDGASYLTWSSAACVLRYDAATGALLERYDAPQSGGFIVDAARSADGTRVVAAAHEGLWVWEGGASATPRLVKTPTRHARRVAFTPDSRRLLVSFDNKSVEVWDARAADRLLAIDGDQGALGAAFDHFGTRLVVQTNFAVLEIPGDWHGRTPTLRSPASGATR